MSNVNNDIAVADKNESAVVDCAELPHNHESDHSIFSNQPNEQAKKDDVVIKLEAKIKKSEEGLLSSACCIYRVPHLIRELKQEAYTPKAVSIGPFHHGKERLQNMEGHKQIFFKRFIQKARTTLDDLVNFAKLSESKVRACYSENIQLSKDKLVEVILVDGGFIIELFMSSLVEGWFIGSDAELLKPWLLVLVTMDLLLLENQLPFFFLEELFNRAFPLENRGDSSPFRWFTYQFFGHLNIQKLEPNYNATIEHFTDLLRLFNLPGCACPRKGFDVTKTKVLQYSVSKLNDAGVKFKVNENKCLLDLKFSGKVLEIPKVVVDDSTGILFRNMIALEQCHYHGYSYITDYALIMDYLINTIKDVDVLVDEGIICNILGDYNDIVKAFDGIGKNTVISNFNSNYLDICKRLNAFCKDCWREKKAALRRDYCKTPWQTAASFAAIVLLILTLVQTICSVLQVRPM